MVIDRSALDDDGAVYGDALPYNDIHIVAYAIWYTHLCPERGDDYRYDDVLACRTGARRRDYTLEANE